MLSAHGGGQHLSAENLAGHGCDSVYGAEQCERSGGDASQAPELTEGAGYEYRAVTDPDNLHVLTEPFGQNENRGALDDTDILERNGSMVTAFVNAYYEKTGVPVVAISASRGSSSLNGWLNSGRKEEAADRLNAAKECLKKEKIRARHIYMSGSRERRTRIWRRPGMSIRPCCGSWWMIWRSRVWRIAS